MEELGDVEAAGGGGEGESSAGRGLSEWRGRRRGETAGEAPSDGGNPSGGVAVGLSTAGGSK